MNSILRVTVPAESQDLTVLATVKAELGITDADTTNDDRLATLIVQASNICASYCNRVFGMETIEETFWPDSSLGLGARLSEALILRRRPVSEIASIVVDDETLTADVYRTAPERGLVYRLTDTGYPRAWCFSKSLIVTYTGGYLVLDDLPYPIERACINLIKLYWNQSGSRDPTIRSEEIPGVRSVTYWIDPPSTASLPRDVTDLLDPYRDVAVG